MYIKEQGEEGVNVALVLSLLGILYIRTNNLSGAKECLQRALDIRERKLGHESYEVGETLSSMASLYGLLGQFEDAVSSGKRALVIMEHLYGMDSIAVAKVLVILGEVRMINRFHDKREREKGIERDSERKEIYKI